MSSSSFCLVLFLSSSLFPSFPLSALAPSFLFPHSLLFLPFSLHSFLPSFLPCLISFPPFSPPPPPSLQFGCYFVILGPQVLRAEFINPLLLTHGHHLSRWVLSIFLQVDWFTLTPTATPFVISPQGNVFNVDLFACKWYNKMLIVDLQPSIFDINSFDINTTFFMQ